MDWLTENDLLVLQSDGIISLWKIHKEIILYQRYTDIILKILNKFYENFSII